MIFLFVLLVIINVIFNLDALMNCIYSSLFVWFYNIYPSIFIFYNISNYLLNNSFFIKISKLFRFLIKFECEKSYVLFAINLFLGNPGTAKLLSNCYESNEINEHDFKLLNNITFFMNPIFVLNVIIFKYYIIYIISLFIYIIIYCLLSKNKNNFVYKSDFFYRKYTFQTFSDSLNDCIYILLNVACLITFFNITKTSILYILSILGIDFRFINIILSFLEVATGLNYLIEFNNLYLIISLISFQGLCILIQSFNIINKKNISFKRYIFNHIISSFSVTLIFYIITILFHI